VVVDNFPFPFPLYDTNCCPAAESGYATILLNDLEVVVFTLAKGPLEEETRDLARDCKHFNELRPSSISERALSRVWPHTPSRQAASPRCL
jgi:hypothetical protein